MSVAFGAETAETFYEPLSDKEAAQFISGEIHRLALQGVGRIKLPVAGVNPVCMTLQDEASRTRVISHFRSLGFFVDIDTTTYPGQEFLAIGWA